MRLANMLIRLRGPLALKDPEVAGLLRLSDTQQLRIRNATRWSLAALRSRMRALRQGGSSVRPLRESLRELNRETERAVVSLLTEEQKLTLERLSQRSQRNMGQDPR